MADLIDRQAAIDALEGEMTVTGRANADAVFGYVNLICDRIKRLPSVEAKPARQTAEWIYGEKDGADGWYCSKCGFHIPWYYEYYGLNNINFIRDFHTCPHCDSKMMKYTGMEREQNG